MPRNAPAPDVTDPSFRARTPAPAPRGRPSKLSSLSPPDWDGPILADWTAGLLTQQAICTKHGITIASLRAHSTRYKWPKRDMGARARQIAQQKQALAEDRAQKAVTAQESPAALQAVDDAATALMRVQTAHRADIRRARGVLAGLWEELEALVLEPGALAQVQMLLTLGRELEPGEEAALQRLVRLVGDLPGRAKVARDLAESLRIVVGLEREAWGLRSDDGAKPVVIIRDYTGKGAPEAPPQALEPGPDGVYTSDGAPVGSLGGVRRVG